MEPVLPPHASSVVSWGIAALALLVAAFVVIACARGGDAAGGRWRALGAGAVLALWLAATWGLAERGVLARFANRPPPFAVVVALGVAGALALGLSPLGARLANALPFAALVGLQSFRLPLELVMHRAAIEGVMPVQMSYSGRNFDIVSGALALALFLLLTYARVPRWAVWGFNVVGFLLLVNIVGVAIASLPPVHAFGTAPERLNTWVAFPPYVWLPTVLVPGALLGHVLLTRRLRANP